MAQLLLPSWLAGIGGPLVVLALGFMRHPFDTDLTLSQKAKIFSGLPIGATGAKNMQQWFSMLRDGGPLKRIDGDAYELEETFDSWSSTTERTPKLLVVLGDDDVVIDHEATKQLFSKLNKTCKIMVEPTYGHIDFLWSGIESTKKIHNEIERFLQVC
jgi:pimeloyl-ACP methyl ester carboxylesterase